jgi:hypothetical protein
MSTGFYFSTEGDDRGFHHHMIESYTQMSSKENIQ